jgi:hypothetical protein
VAIAIHRSWKEYLAGRPETGMGYQIVEFRERVAPAEYLLIANGADVVEARHGRIVVRERMAPNQMERALHLLVEPGPDDRFRVLTRAQALAANVLERKARTGNGPANESPLKESEPNERFRQPGGGAEVIFEKGSPPGTKYNQDTIPPGQ